MNLSRLLAKLDAPIVIPPTRRMTQGEGEPYKATLLAAHGIA
jgi:hypothetical protein